MATRLICPRYPVGSLSTHILGRGDLASKILMGWDMIPGARGCTPQSCSFRDHFAELKALGVDQLFGLSTQDSGYQREAAERLHLPFTILSDEHLKLTRAMNLPIFETSGMTLLKRFTLEAVMNLRQV
jgi:Redoxin